MLMTLRVLLISEQVFSSVLCCGGEVWKDKALIVYGYNFFFFLPIADRKEKTIVPFVDNKEAFFREPSDGFADSLLIHSCLRTLDAHGSCL